MTPELQKYYETYFDLFVSDGWKQFIEDVEQSAESFDIRNVKDESALKFIQGQLLILDKLVNWENGITTSYETIVNEESNEE